MALAVAQRYQLQERIGKGSFGEVWKGYIKAIPFYTL